jgi:hypothetical protein
MEKILNSELNKWLYSSPNQDDSMCSKLIPYLEYLANTKMSKIRFFTRLESVFSIQFIDDSNTESCFTFSFPPLDDATYFDETLIKYNLIPKKYYKEFKNKIFGKISSFYKVGDIIQYADGIGRIVESEYFPEIKQSDLVDLQPRSSLWGYAIDNGIERDYIHLISLKEDDILQKANKAIADNFAKSYPEKDFSKEREDYYSEKTKLKKQRTDEIAAMKDVQYNTGDFLFIPDDIGGFHMIIEIVEMKDNSIKYNTRFVGGNTGKPITLTSPDSIMDKWRETVTKKLSSEEADTFMKDGRDPIYDWNRKDIRHGGEASKKETKIVAGDHYQLAMNGMEFVYEIIKVTEKEVTYKSRISSTKKWGKKIVKPLIPFEKWLSNGVSKVTEK